MNKPAGPWALVRHVWARNFQQNPIGTVAGSLFTVGAVGFMLFFGFFVVIALVVVGVLFMLAHALFGTPTRRTGWSAPGAQAPRGAEAPRANRDSQRNNNELEGEFTVVPDEKVDRS